MMVGGWEIKIERISEARKMESRKDELATAVLALSREERAELAHRLIESLEEDSGGDFEAEWIEESERRYAEYRNGLVTGRPGVEVFRDAKARLQ